MLHWGQRHDGIPLDTNKSTTRKYTDSKEGLQAADQKMIWQGSECHLLKLKPGICDIGEPLFWREEESKV